jgi:hypothetical protein
LQLLQSCTVKGRNLIKCSTFQVSITHSRWYCLGAYRIKTDHTGVWRI